EAGGRVGVAGKGAANSERGFAGGGRRVGAGAVEQSRADRLAEAPVVEQAGGFQYAFGVGGLFGPFFFGPAFAFDGQDPNRRSGAAFVVGHPQVDADRGRGRVAAGRDRARAGVGLIAAVAVEVPLVFGDRAVGV